MEFNSSIPIYTQILEEFKRRIAAGILQPGDRISPVRELAVDWGVNPNTMQRALAALEAEGLLYTERTSGRFVTQDASKVAAMRARMLHQAVRQFADTVAAMGFTLKDILPIWEEHQKGGEETP